MEREGKASRAHAEMFTICSLWVQKKQVEFAADKNSI
jgi:hypothetical protein